MKKIIYTLILTLIANISFAQVSSLENEIIIKKNYITIGYNSNYKIPNFVYEELTRTMIVGTEKREPGFYPENFLPINCQTRSKDYIKSGYDRGHLAPAADFKWDKTAMYESFSMANVAPQWPSVNRGNWQQLESKVRQATRKSDRLYIITGTIVTNPRHKIKNNIVIPTYFYKAVIGVKNNRCNISVAWIYNNDATQLSKKISIDELEEIIGRDLFTNINNEHIESLILWLQ